MKAILFDMDGTMLASMHAWHAAESGVFDALNIPRDMIDYDLLVTSGLEEALSLVKKMYNIPVDIPKAWKHIRDYMERFYTSEVQLCPGVIQTLEYFHQRGIPLGVGTATMQELADKAIDFTGLRRYFDFVYSASSNGYNKNDMDYFASASQRFGVPPKDMALFDDALYALIAAKQLGCKTVGVQDLSGEQNTEAIKRHADTFIEGFETFDAELWLNQWEGEDNETI